MDEQQALPRAGYFCIRGAPGQPMAVSPYPETYVIPQPVEQPDDEETGGADAI